MNAAHLDYKTEETRGSSMSVLLSNGSLIHYNGKAPKIGSEVTAVLKNPDGSIEMVRAEVLAIWEKER